MDFPQPGGPHNINTFGSELWLTLLSVASLDDDFKCFIQNMHDIGFYSKYDSKIEFLKLVTETINESVNKSVTRIHNYKFQSKTKKIEKEHKNKNKNKNKSTYHTEILYKK